MHFVPLTTSLTTLVGHLASSPAALDLAADAIFPLLATLCRADGTKVELTVDPVKGLTLEQMQEAVGGYIEIVTIGGTARRREVLIINDNGVRLDLPLNEYATQRYRDDPPRHDGIILGDVIEAVVVDSGTARARIV